MSPARGRSGVAPFPPASFASIELPTDVVPVGTPLYRVHRTTYDPIFLGPGPGAPATHRFDSPSSTFGVLYVALGLAGCRTRSGAERTLVTQMEGRSGACL